MKPRYWFVLLCASHIGWAQADIYKHVDADGHVTYSSTPTKGAKKLDLGPLPPSSTSSTSPPPARARNPSPSDFPRVDNNTQRNRDDTRHKILGDELATEDKLLTSARHNLRAGEENPEMSVGQDGKTYRNVAKYEEKIKSLQGQVMLHEKNIEALKTELSKLR